MDVSSSIDLYDSEFPKLEAALKPLQEKQQKPVDMESFRKEIIERFAEQGFEVEVKVWTTNLSGVYITEIEIVDRIDPIPIGEFDHDRQRHEVVNDILDIDPSMKGETFKAPNAPSKKGFIIKRKPHRH